MNRHNCIYWAPDNPHLCMDKAVNLLGVSVWCGLSVRGLIGPFFFEGIITGAVYLDMLQIRILPAIQILYGDQLFYMQVDGTLPHYHQDVRLYLDRTPPGRWVGRRGTVKFSLGHLIWHLWETVKNDVDRQRPATIKETCAAITPDTLTAVVQSAVQHHGHCIQVAGDHFEHIP